MADILRSVGTDTDGPRVRQAEREARRRLHRALGSDGRDTQPEVWTHYFAEIFRETGVPEARLAEAGRLLTDTHGADHLWTQVAEGTTETLSALAAAGYRLGVISNADGRMEALLESVGLRGHFEFVVDSEVFGATKPDPEIFLEGCRRMALPAGECLYVGDLYPVDYLGATRAGLQAILFDPWGFRDDGTPRIRSLGELPSLLAGPGA
jgi:HAD superfamily hydrolase (TIGR01549 family)